MSRLLTRREFLRDLTLSGLAISGLSSLSIFLEGCKPAYQYRIIPQKVIVLGFDGIDPNLLEKWVSAGLLPNIRRLMTDGTYSRLRTTNPAESPVAWSSFATGLNPGKHGIYDFLTRNPLTYFPDFAQLTYKKSEFLFGLIPIKKPMVISNRGGISFWKLCADNGIKTVAISAPIAFPAEEINGGKLLSGLGVPDIRGTMGTFSYYATDLTEETVSDTEMGGKLVPISIKNGEVNTVIFGPRNPIPNSKKRDILVPVTFRVDKTNQRVTIILQGQQQTVKVNKWSDWFEIAFEITPLVTVYGICRFYILQVIPELRIYLAPINLHPAKPPFPTAYPKSFGVELVKELGLYKTLGWQEDTWALNENRINEDVFLEDVYYSTNELEKIAIYSYDKYRPNLFVAVFQGADRVEHMFWRFIDKRHPAYNHALAEKYSDAICKYYQKMDEIIGRFMRYVDENTTLIVMSDHGFKSYRKSVNLNTWLVKSGFMSLETTETREYNLENLFGREAVFFPNVDWSRTVAYVLGLGQIYINLMGREREGAVMPGKHYEEVCATIRSELKKLVDPVTKEKVVREVYLRDEIYSGSYLDKAPDLVVGFNDGYRISWQSCLGGMPPEIIQENRKNWSGDHCSFDPHITPGIILINKKIPLSNPHIIDIAPTVLKLLEVPIPKELDGKSLIV